MNEKLLKLYALAKRGIGGEKVNAEKILQRMLKDANLTMADLEREEYPERMRFIRSASDKYLQRVLLQIIFCVINKNEINYHLCRKPRGIKLKLTDIQYAEIILRWNIYSKAFKKERDILLRAFIQKHRLYSNLPRENAAQTISEEDLAVLKRMRELDDIIIPRQLNGQLLEAK